MSSAAHSLPPEPSDEDLPFSPSPTIDWIRAHFDEVQRHKGKNIAIDPAKGILTSGTYEEVVGWLDAAGVDPDSDVVIHWVR